MSDLFAQLQVTMAGSFQVVATPESSPHPSGIAFRQIVDVPVTKEDTQFAIRVAARLRSLKRMVNYDAHFTEKEPFRGAFTSLLGIAKTGVEYPNGALAVGEAGLRDFEESTLVDIGRPARDRFFYIQIVSCVVVALLGIVTIAVAPKGSAYVAGLDKTGRAIGFDMIGVAIAVLLAGFWRNKTITWENIEYFDPDAFNPFVRLFGVILLSVVLMALLYKKALILGVGSIALNDFLDSEVDAMTVGFLCGLSEIPVIKIVQGIFDAAKAKSPVTPP
jgi:hypothetical protein